MYKGIRRVALPYAPLIYISVWVCVECLQQIKQQQLPINIHVGKIISRHIVSACVCDILSVVVSNCVNWTHNKKKKQQQRHNNNNNNAITGYLKLFCEQMNKESETKEKYIIIFLNALEREREMCAKWECVCKKEEAFKEYKP